MRWSCLLWLSLIGSVSFAQDNLSDAAALWGSKEYRDFTSSSGTKMRARLLSFDRTSAKVKVRSSLGKNLEIPLSSLSDSDQGFVEEWNPNEWKKEVLGDYSLDDFLTGKGYGIMPFTFKEERLFVATDVNGTRFDFLVDPGRFLTLFHKPLATQVGAKMTDIAYGDFPLSDGSIEVAYAGTVKTFHVGTAKYGPWDMGIADLEEIGFGTDGVMGADFFHLNDAVIDWRKKHTYLKPLKKQEEDKAAEEETPTLAPGQLREFTSAAGSKLTAELRALDAGEVTLAADGGKEVKLPLSSLSEPDREYIETWTSNPLNNGSYRPSVSDIVQANGFLEIPYSYGNSAVAAFEMNVNGTPMRFLLNTSIPRSYLSRATMDEAQITVNPTNDVVFLEGVQHQVFEAQDLVFSIGSEPLKPMNVGVIELAPGSELASPIRTCVIFRFPELKERLKAKDIDGILGLDWMIENGVLIDYRTKKIFVLLNS